MKNFIYLSIISLVFISCSGSSDDPVTPPITNTAPTVPTLVGPVDNKLCLDNTVSFQWNKATDKENDAITYQIQVAKDNTFAQIEKTFDGADNVASFVLSKNTAYYWRIKATDAKGLASAYSATFKFYTSGDAVVNHLPFAPELVQPIMNAALSTTTATLKWTASDVDTADVLTYDVYFGTANPPTAKASENQGANSLDVTIEPGKQYFWRVVVKDNKGGETVGQVWKFKTN
ncbi:fibronectin type III domain-containing protein [Flavobacterium daemonense]|uniref:fibronectin type III domain-containing protein n=1 Tax=Flavobacterium daemonense TaxID=1393049 RepID=UPI001186B5DF|nr:fibronectin type III domain-containing protein [Flavobacterium daemonense]KAF2336284.1 fibronectin type III domain-containing protein [Flavobacterium daemonense]